MSQKDTFIQAGLPRSTQQAQRIFNTTELKTLQQVKQANVVLRLLENPAFQRNTLFRSERLTLTYAEANTHVNRIANYLKHQCHLVSGNRVLLRGVNSVELALAWLAVVKCGLIAVTTMPLLRAKELREIIAKAQPSLFFCDAPLLHELLLAESHAKTITLNGTDSNSLLNLTQHERTVFPAFDAAHTDIALIAFTSGTTGKPKAAVHSHGDLLAACECWPRHVLKPEASDIVVGTPPLAFTFGLGGELIFPMWCGASVYFPAAPYTPASMAETIKTIRATTLYTSPTFYRQLAAHALANQLDLSSLKHCVSAGEALPEATRRLWRERTGLALIDGIGATELFHIFISSTVATHKQGAIGQVVRGYVAQVVDEAGNAVPHGEVGRLAVMGPTGCQYFGDERQAQYVKAGWNYPGDTFTQDAEGYFYFQSRADDMIITGGYNVGGHEVEDCLLTHPAVAECGVVGKPDEARGMLIKAFVVLQPEIPPSEKLVKLLQAFVKEALAPYKYPREIEFVASLPRTETGKLQRYQLRSPT
jgi:2-aminobenzoate-CoA ligase